MRKAFLPLILLAGIAGMIATSPYRVSADFRQPSAQASVVPMASSAAVVTQLQPISAKATTAQIPVASALSIPEAGGLFLMGFGLLVSAIYLRRKLLHHQK